MSRGIDGIERCDSGAGFAWWLIAIVSTGLCTGEYGKWAADWSTFVISCLFVIAGRRRCRRYRSATERPNCAYSQPRWASSMIYISGIIALIAWPPVTAFIV